MSNLIRHRPFIDWPALTLGEFENELARILGERRGSLASIEGGYLFPTIDIKEEKDKYIINADIPGVDLKSIEIYLEDGVLTIKGKRESEIKEEKDKYLRIERMSGSFYRSFNLPDADSENIKASYNNGVLNIIAPKLAKRAGRKVEIKSGS